MSSRSARNRRRALRRRLPAGTPPGTIQVDPAAPRPRLVVTAYSADALVEREVADVKEVQALRGQWPVVWLNVEGLGDGRLIETIGSCFGLHRLALEDVVNVHQRAKVDLYGENLFFVARMTGRGEGAASEQLGLFLGVDFVVTFQERRGDRFELVRARLRRGGPIRAGGPDYLAYALIDAAVDNWFPVLERQGERLEELEDQILMRPSRPAVIAVHELRRELLALRRAVWPLRDALGALHRDPTPLIRDETRVYLRDCYDHAVQILDLVETGRETAAQLTELYLSSVSNRMNEVMKVLTVISTIFLPLSFIASVYGMNFNTEASFWNMPELSWRWGYPFALALMVITLAVMLYYFRRRGWLGPEDWKGQGENEAESAPSAGQAGS